MRWCIAREREHLDLRRRRLCDPEFVGRGHVPDVIGARGKGDEACDRPRLWIDDVRPLGGPIAHEENAATLVGRGRAEVVRTVVRIARAETADRANRKRIWIDEGECSGSPGGSEDAPERDRVTEVVETD